MSLLAEKNVLKSTSVFDCLRLLTLRDLLLETKPQSVELISAETTFVEAMRSLCASMKIAFLWDPKYLEKSDLSLRSVWKKLPPIFKAVIFLARYLIQRWPLRRVESQNWFSGESSVFLFSYFIHLDREACISGRFYSRQWDVLPELLQHSGKRINWIHHFLFSQVVPDTGTGIRWVNTFNKDSRSQGLHSFLGSFLTVGTVAKALRQWLGLTLCLKRLNKSLEKTVLKHPMGWLWPLLRPHWQSSVYGTVAIQNLLWVQLFNRAMADLPKQRLGLYLCENQGWERAFIHCWKKHGHGHLIAVPHSTVRYWDLRYFDDPRVWVAKDSLAQPLPDKIAVNGSAAWKAYQDANQPMKRLVEVEALRYLHLERLPHNEHSNTSTRGVHGEATRILVLGDIQRNATDSMLKMLESIAEFFQQGWALTLKPHPANLIQLGDYPRLNITITDAPLEQLLPRFHVAIASIFTSAALEGYATGLPLVTLLDDRDFNFSPLRGEPGAVFVSTAEELKYALESMLSDDSSHRREDFFWTDSDLPRWKSLLGLIENESITIQTDNAATHADAF